MNYFIIIIFTLICINNSLLSQNQIKDDNILAKEIAKPTQFIEQAFDVFHYDVYLNLTKAPTPETNGICRIHIKWKDTPDTNKFYFHLRDLIVDSAFYGNQRIITKEIGDKSSPTYHYELTPPYGKIGDTVIITIYYHGRMTTEPTSPYWGGVGSRGTSLFAMGVGFYNNYVSATQHWMPCYDHPSDKATFRGLFEVKSDKTVASVGKLIKNEIASDTTRIFEWETKYPAATYLLTFAVDNYIHISIPGSDTPVDIYTLRNDSAASARNYRLVPKMIEAFEQRFGKYPFEKAGYVNTPIGAMEHQTMISYPANLIRSTDSINMIAAHELAHQWFGNLVTCKDFRDAWLNESFATYCESLWLEYLFGFEKYLANQKAKTERYLNSISKQEGVFPLYDFPRTPPSSNYPETIYQKGAVVLGMLRYELGDSLFFGSLKHYLNKFAYSSANTEDLKNSIEEFTGIELDWFFNQWVYGKGWPVLSFEDYWSGNEFYELELRYYKTQIKDWATFENIPIEFNFKLKNGDYFTRVKKLNSADERLVIDSIPRSYTGPWLMNSYEPWNLFKDINPKLVHSLLEFTVSGDVAEDQNNENGIAFYPNPANSFVRIEFIANQGFADLNIINSFGQEIIKTIIITDDDWNNFHFDTKSLPSGIYLVKIRQGTKTLTGKFVIAI